MVAPALFSKGKDDWQTPKQLFDWLDAEFNFTLDAAANAENHLCPRWLGPGSRWPDAITVSWSGDTCWLNPPYSQIATFMAKAVLETSQPGTTVVALVPARTDTRWWHEYVWSRLGRGWNFGVRGNFLKGRLKFGGGKHSAPFPSVVLVFRHPGTTSA